MYKRATERTLRERDSSLPKRSSELQGPVASAADLPVPTAVIVGSLCALTEFGAPLVESPAAQGTVLEARTSVHICADDVGREVALLFEHGDPLKPIIIGLLCSSERAAPTQVRLDGERLTLSADKEIVLSCGEASITLTREGKVLIRGSYLLTRSSGVNRIKGAAVQIN